MHDSGGDVNQDRERQLVTAERNEQNILFGLTGRLLQFFVAGMVENVAMNGNVVGFVSLRLENAAGCQDVARSQVFEVDFARNEHLHHTCELSVLEKFFAQSAHSFAAPRQAGSLELGGDARSGDDAKSLHLVLQKHPDDVFVCPTQDEGGGRGDGALPQDGASIFPHTDHASARHIFNHLDRQRAQPIGGVPLHGGKLVGHGRFLRESAFVFLIAVRVGHLVPEIGNTLLDIANQHDGAAGLS